MRTLLLLLLLFACVNAVAAEEKLEFGRFGPVTIYRQSPHPAHVILFVSGDGGWNQGVVDMARQLAGLDSLVIGIDINHYLRSVSVSTETCTYAAADFEMLSQYVQKKLEMPAYEPPVLIGYSSGATLVYAVLVQAPTGTFRGAISLGFCPDLPLKKPFCRENGLQWKVGANGKGYVFLPDPLLKSPWVVLQGTIDKVCDSTVTAKYAGEVGHAHFVLLPAVGHGFSKPRHWFPQLKQAFTSLYENEEPIRRPSAPDVSDLPLVEIPAREPATDLFAVMISGDGGWAGIDRDLGATLAAHGIPVAGLSSLEYFWNRRTPEEASKDLERILRHYFDKWEKSGVILIGYSLGADVLPFMADRLPPDLRAGVRLIALLGPSREVDFEFHLSDWLGNLVHRPELPVLPEIYKLKGSPVLCIYGDDEDDSLCRNLEPGSARVVAVKGGHHFAGNYEALAQIIMKDAQ